MGWRVGGLLLMGLSLIRRGVKLGSLCFRFFGFSSGFFFLFSFLRFF